MKGLKKKVKKAKCPYCGKKISYFTAFAEKNNGEYTCKNCGRNSTIYFVRAFKILIILAFIAAIILMFISISPMLIDSLWGIPLVLIPFVILYLCTPVYFRLVPIKKKNSNKQDKVIYNPSNKSESTKIIPSINEKEEKNIVNDGKTKIMPAVGRDDNNDDFMDISNIKF